MNAEISIECEVEKIIVRKDNDWSVMAAIDEKGSRFSVVGISHAVAGSTVKVTGIWESNKFGRQIKAKSIHAVDPSTTDGIVRFLSSGFIKGIGEKTAKIIVDRFGTETIKVLDNEPHRLLEVRGIGKGKLETIIGSWSVQRTIADIMLFLAENNVSAALARRIFNEYQNDSIRIIQTQPYRLTVDIPGVGFKTADTVAKKIGIAFDSPLRLDAGVIYALNESQMEGHCGVEEHALVKKTQALLSPENEVIDAELIRAAIKRLLSENKPPIMIDTNKRGETIVYLKALFHAERNAASVLLNLAQGTVKTSQEAIEKAINDAVAAQPITLGESQVNALKVMLSSRFSVMTGGPGTGKTSTLKTLLAAFDLLGITYALAAPTGKAAKRMSEATGREAQTIHRMLGLGSEEQNEVETDVLILDESSMIDIRLMSSMLDLLGNARLILVGDKDQLPSVGAGQVLKDIIASGVVPVANLDRVYRQSEHSKIGVNAARINQGMMPLPQNREDDFLFKPVHDFDRSPMEVAQEVAREIVRIVCEVAPSHFGFDPFKDVLVLSPVRKGDAGVDTLNKLLQERLNPSPEKHISSRGFRFGLGDKVMQTRNNYNLQIFNGDTGIITDINTEAETVTIDFTDQIVTVTNADMLDIVLAYATTIHKSQGSESPMVVIPMSSQHHFSQNRNLLYTGVTRAKKSLVLVGQKKSLRRCVDNDEVRYRTTMLKELLQI